MAPVPLLFVCVRAGGRVCVCVCVWVHPLIKTVSGLVIKMHYHPIVSREETHSLSLCLLSLCHILILSFIYSLTPSLQGCGEVVEGVSFLFSCPISSLLISCYSFFSLALFDLSLATLLPHLWLHALSFFVFFPLIFCPRFNSLWKVVEM